MRRRRLLFAATILASATSGALADGLLQTLAPAVQGLGSPVTSQAMKPGQTPNTAYYAGNPSQQQSTGSNDPLQGYVFNQPTPTGPTVIYQGAANQPPAGLTGGTVCQNNVCQLMPVAVQPSVSPTTTAATPRFPPNYSGTSFITPASPAPNPSPASGSPRGVSLNVAPTAQSTDLSKTRAEILQVLPKP